jgi:hypothetical protein
MLLSTQKLLLGCRPCAVCSSLCSTSKHQRLFSSRVGKRSDEMVRSPLLASYLQQTRAAQLSVNGRLQACSANHAKSNRHSSFTCCCSCMPSCSMQQTNSAHTARLTAFPCNPALPTPQHAH